MVFEGERVFDPVIVAAMGIAIALFLAIAAPYIEKMEPPCPEPFTFDDPYQLLRVVSRCAGYLINMILPFSVIALTLFTAVFLLVRIFYYSLKKRF